jgi:hypothetical protein
VDQETPGTVIGNLNKRIDAIKKDFEKVLLGHDVPLSIKSIVLSQDDAKDNTENPPIASVEPITMAAPTFQWPVFECWQENGTIICGWRIPF